MAGAVRADDLIAVYGLLRQGASAWRAFDLASAFAALGPCVLGGALYDFGDYPGLVPGEGKGEVTAELFAITDPAIIDRLDAFEDYYPGDPVRTRYARQRLSLLVPSGARAWVYVRVWPLEGAPRIAHGDWLRHVRERPAGPHTA